RAPPRDGRGPAQVLPGRTPAAGERHPRPRRLPRGDARVDRRPAALPRVRPAVGDPGGQLRSGAELSEVVTEAETAAARAAGDARGSGRLAPRLRRARLPVVGADALLECGPGPLARQLRGQPAELRPREA